MVDTSSRCSNTPKKNSTIRNVGLSSIFEGYSSKDIENAKNNLKKVPSVDSSSIEKRVLRPRKNKIQ